MPIKYKINDLGNFDETLLKKRISDKIKINELPHAVTTRNS